MHPIVIAGLLMIAKTWKQPKYPSKDEWIKKMWYRSSCRGSVINEADCVHEETGSIPSLKTSICCEFGPKETKQNKTKKKKKM